MTRVAAFDYSSRRIGVAISDPTRTIAYPLATVSRREGKRPPWPELTRLLEEHEVGEVVIGLPLDLSGAEGPWAVEVREFGAQVERRTGLPVHWIDERLSSVRAERAVRGMGLKKSEREEKGRVDAAAAALILEAFLATGRTSSEEQ